MAEIDTTSVEPTIKLALTRADLMILIRDKVDWLELMLADEEIEGGALIEQIDEVIRPLAEALMDMDEAVTFAAAAETKLAEGKTRQ